MIGWAAGAEGRLKAQMPPRTVEGGGSDGLEFPAGDKHHTVLFWQPCQKEEGRASERASEGESEQASHGRAWDGIALIRGKWSRKELKVAIDLLTHS